MWSEREVVILGSGGHARAVWDALRANATPVRGFLAPSADGSRLGDVPWLGGDDELAGLSGVDAVIGLGSTGEPSRRVAAFERARAAGLSIRSVVHPSAVVAESAVLGRGVQVMLGAVIGAGVRLGSGVIVNSGAVIDHDCVVGAQSHIAPGAVLAGDVIIGERVHVGLGARIIQGVVVGEAAIVGAGAVLLEDVRPHDTVVGVPARRRERDEEEN